MDQLLDLSVTLVVKAPNQKIADMTVECTDNWTIQKLKDHLTSVYPNKPQRHEQRLIYSGKLLQDHLQLRDVLRKYAPDQKIHTVHLVCSNPPPSNTPPSSPDMSTAEGVRHRRTAQEQPEADSNPSTRRTSSEQPATDGTPSTQTTTAFTSSEQTHTDYNQSLYGASGFSMGGMGYPTTTVGGMAYPHNTLGAMDMPQPAMVPGFPYSQEQMLWLQQMYAQHMANYMQQYYQQAQMPTPTSDHTGQQPANQNAAHVPPANQQPAQERNQPMVMNAAGEAMMDDDDEGNVQRDWLDWLYTFSRFGVLLSIVYFYSTISRFLIVVGFILFLYMYQTGWFQIRREQRRAPEQPARRDQPPEENLQNAENLRREEGIGGENDSSPDDQQEDTTADTTSAPEQPAVAAPGVIRVAWSFFFTFFTSLMPTPPPPVNIN